MWKSPTVSFLVGQLARLGASRVQTAHCSYNRMVQSQIFDPRNANAPVISEDQYNDKTNHQSPEKTAIDITKYQISKNISRKEKVDFLISTLLDLKDSKEVIYGALDSWVAWEENFPIVSLRRALIALEKEEQWHRVIQVIKWMLSKGQGTTMGVYGQLIRALDMDDRPDEAHQFWEKKIGIDLHSVPWQLCKRMIAIYYRNNMLENLVRLFEGLEAYDRKPPDKSIVVRVANAYELLGRLKERDRILEKYDHLFTDDGSSRKSKEASSKNKKKKKPGNNA